MEDVSIKLDDNLDIVLNDLENKMPEVLNAMGNEIYKQIYDFMTEDKVVDTGRLRGSISYSTPFNNYNNPTDKNITDDFIRDVKEKDTVIYGSNVEYASFVNSGTTKQRARRFIETGTYRAMPLLKGIVQNILTGEK